MEHFAFPFFPLRQLAFQSGGCIGLAITISVAEAGEGAVPTVRIDNPGLGAALRGSRHRGGHQSKGAPNRNGRLFSRLAVPCRRVRMFPLLVAAPKGAIYAFYIAKRGTLCLNNKHSSVLGGTPAKANRHPRRLVSSSGKRSSTFEKASMALDLPNKRLPLGFRRPDAPASSCPRPKLVKPVRGRASRPSARSGAQAQR